jgi:DNA invertase Pin-like site-specific DNA recombinase
MQLTWNKSTLIGYIRVSSSDKTLDAQKAALRDIGCFNIFEDFAKYYATMQRYGLVRLRNILRSGDTLVIWRLDRLSYSMTGLLQFIDELGRKGVAFKSLSENINLSSYENCKFMDVFNAISPYMNEDFEANGWRKLATKRAEGRMGTRAKTLNIQVTTEILSFLNDAVIPIASIAERYNISRATIYSTLIQGAVAKSDAMIIS